MKTRLTDALTKQTHECMICCDTVRRKHAVWSCQRCFAILHLGCTKTWAKKVLTTGVSWRCPACQHAYEDVPREYVCFCGNTVDPPINRYLVPHACDQTCKRERDAALHCPHPCLEPCHPGPCAPCTATQIAFCYCGKQEYSLRCTDPSRIQGISCQLVCDKLLSCGVHRCKRICHSGECTPCAIQTVRECFCYRQETRIIACGQSTPHDTYILDTLGQSTNLRIGHFSCESACNRLFDCGIHACQKPCHPMGPDQVHCPLSPDVITTCPCGKKLLADISTVTRNMCSDPITTCGRVCEKILPCGHPCQSDCHTGACPPCQTPVQQPCRCQASIRTLLCSEIHGQEYMCERKCDRKLACGRHRCIEPCCPARTYIAPPGVDAVEAQSMFPLEHQCSRICGKKLRCGGHTCPLECHPGPCPPCLQAGFDELICPCGRTKLFPPIPCNARLPPCPYTCTLGRRYSTCSHPIPTHPCHPVEESCPMCTVLTTKRCRCGKHDIAHIPCHRSSPSCGEPCGKPLSCGGHVCRKLCHEGPCEIQNESCKQICGKPKGICGHPCEQPCHAPSMCAGSSECRVPVMIFCPCKRRSAKIECRQSLLQSLHSLDCDDVCEKMNRLKRMAQALDIQRDPDVIPVIVAYEPELLEQFKADQEFAERVEHMLIEFTVSSRQTQGLPPMRSAQRQLVHMLAKHFSIDTEAHDPEPRRSVFLYRRPDTRLPAVRLRDAIKLLSKPGVNMNER